VQSQEISILPPSPPFRRDWNFLGDGVSEDQKIFKKLKLEFLAAREGVLLK